MTQQRIALVLGATGGIGGEVARRLATRGWQVRALHRRPDTLAQRDARFEWRPGDAMRRADVTAAAEGAALIVHAVNPPGYRDWDKLVLPMIDSSIAAARVSSARIVLPGTVYNFGPDAFPILSESSPQRPRTRKGQIRAELERRLRIAAADGVRTLVVRAGDFFGPGAASNWFAGGLVKPGKPLRAMTYPGQAGIGHQWAYVPDVAETMLRLIGQSERLPDFAVYHMRGHWDADGTAMIGAVRRASGRADLPVRGFPWRLLPLLAPFSTLLREIREMRYLWQQPLRMDNAALVQMLGEEPHTGWDDAVSSTLKSLHCL
ncbi:SDR family NAD(P)-dependent oxidoreductase [Pandoraea sp.]|uniref:SDR family NAD(P)-dependent oxidoreductase n=1 Tax=Pandoraea sp. TaxID=1883445 RepID=UPI001208F8C5|nr:SDR family NAD(P)-dependent oxidoreductase [Pandoraea sp.]TAL54489.1 MAG: SDR family NAD(P)-dependent oxidoreductase [Pandoraea sp.]TAM17535.1 MAG: SDR family NAD(P)-dependent oxidoreductase [Pandoraea sp.]